MTTRDKSPELIPVTGGTEVKSVSALLAVLANSPVFARALLGRVGAPPELLSPLGRQNSTVRVEAETQPHFAGESRTDIPDGRLILDGGRGKKWEMLVEAKVNGGTLGEQVDRYYRVARNGNVKLLLLISNDVHFDLWPKNYPLNGNPRTRIEHLSWTEVLSIARRASNDPGTRGKTEGWVLQELGRYLDHPRSGVVKLDNMGKNWAKALQAASSRKLDRDLANDIVRPLSQVFLHSTFGLSEEAATDIAYDLPQGNQHDSAVVALIAGMPFVGAFGGRGIQIEASVDVVGCRVQFSTKVKPEDLESANGRKVDWVLRHLPDRATNLYVETRSGRQVLASHTLNEIRANRGLLLPPRNGPSIGSFRLVLDVPMSKHKTSKGGKASFAKKFERDLLAFHELAIRPFRPAGRSAAA